MGSRAAKLPLRAKSWRSLLLLSGTIWLHGGVQAQNMPDTASPSMMSLQTATEAATISDNNPSQNKSAPQKSLPQSPAIATQVFASLPFVEEATLSPDGHSIAGLFGVGGVQNVVVAEIFGKNPKRVNFQIPDMNEVDWIRWVGNDNIIVGLRALHYVEGGNWYVQRMIAINHSTRKVTRLLWDSGGQMASNVIYIPTDGSPHILVSAQDSIYTNHPDFWPSVYRVDITTGRKSIIQRGRANLLWWGADDMGRVRTGRAFQDGGLKSSLLYRPDDSSALRAVERANLANDEQLSIPFHFIAGTDRAYILNSGVDGRNAIVEMDMLTGETVRTIYDTHPVTSVIMGPNGSKLLGAHILNRDTPIHWFDPELARHQKILQAASPASDVSIISMNADQSKMLVRFSTPDNPGLIYHYDAHSEALNMLASMNEQLGAKRLSRSSYIQYKARDGLDIEAVLTMPRGRSATNLPMIIFPHGGPWAHDQLGYHYIVQFLAERGYAVLQPNFRGSTGYGDNFERAGRGQLGLAMQDDLTDAVRWAVKEGIADPKRLCIAGASYGGYAAMWGIAKDPDLYRCAISISGVSALRREVNDFGGAIHSRLYRQQWEKMSDNFDAISPINAIDRISAPLLLIHGKKDVTVDHSQSSRMHSAMMRAGKRSRFTSVPLADHYFTREADRLTLLTAMEDFLNEHNPAHP